MWSFVRVTVWSCGQVTNEKHCMYTSAIPTITKLGGEVTYSGGPHPLSQVTFYMTNEKPYSCISAKPIASKFERVISYGWKTQPAKSYDLLITWSYEKFKNISVLQQHQWQPDLAGQWLRVGNTIVYEF